MADETQKGDENIADENNEEQLPPEASMAEAEVMLDNEKQASQKELGSTKKKVLGLLLVIILLGAGGFFIFGSSSEDGNSTTTETQATQQDENQSDTETEVAASEFDQIVYAHASSDRIKRDLYSRPATGGDRTALDFDFGVNTYLTFDRDGSGYVVGTRGGKVYYGSGADTPTEIFTATEEIHSLALDSDHGSVLVLERSATAGDDPTTITKVMTDGSGDEVFLQESEDFAKGVPYVHEWDGTNNIMYGSRSCWQCDGYSTIILSFDGEGNEAEVFNPGIVNFNVASGYHFNADNTKALYLTSTEYEEGNDFGILGGIGAPSGAPFTLHELDIASGSSSEVITFGEPEDVEGNGYFDSPVIAWTSSASSQMPVYSYKKKLFAQNGNGSFDNYFETGQGNIRSILNVDDDEVLVGASNSEGETISYFNIDTQQGAIVMETLPSTTILGVTLK